MEVRAVIDSIYRQEISLKETYKLIIKETYFIL